MKYLGKVLYYKDKNVLIDSVCGDSTDEYGISYGMAYYNKDIRNCQWFIFSKKEISEQEIAENVEKFKEEIIGL